MPQRSSAILVTRSTVTELFTAAEEIDPEPAARHFVMLRDGAMTAGCLSEPQLVCDTFLRGVEGLLSYRTHRNG